MTSQYGFCLLLLGATSFFGTALAAAVSSLLFASPTTELVGSFLEKSTHPTPTGGFTTEDSCWAGVTFDIVLALDVSASMRRYAGVPRSVVAPALEEIKELVPGGVRLGLVLFNDKPTSISPSNFCSTSQVSLDSTPEEFTEGLMWAWKHVDMGSYPDTDDEAGRVDSLGTFAVQAANEQLGWRTKSGTEDELHKLMIVFTDQVFKLPGDDMNATRVENDGDANYDCKRETYFSGSQVHQLLLANKVRPLVLTTDDYAARYDRLFYDIDNSNEGAVRGSVLGFSDLPQLATFILSTMYGLCTAPQP